MSYASISIGPCSALPPNPGAVAQRFKDDASVTPGKSDSPPERARSKSQGLCDGVQFREAPKVALLVETTRSFGRDFLRGVARYARLYGPWTFHITPGDFEQALPRIRQWGGNGIIARIPNDRVAKAILDARVPTIALGLTDQQMRPGSPLANLSGVGSNAVHVAQLAIEHLKERRVSHFAYVGAEDRPWSRRRGDAFIGQLQAQGHKVHVYPIPEGRRDRQWDRESKAMANWLQSLPTPLGLFACNDDRGRQVLEACYLANLNVPENVAVLGVDNDSVFCELSDPPLSSIVLNAETAGFRAARLLAALMSGRSRTPQRLEVEALYVVARRSTVQDAVEDSDVSAALQYIHTRQGHSFTVHDVAKAVAVSRRHLEKRFRGVMRRTILEEIQLVRLEYAKRILLETAKPISKVAELCGFGSVTYFCHFFQERVGTTPRRFRIQMTR